VVPLPICQDAKLLMHIMAGELLQLLTTTFADLTDLPTHLQLLWLLLLLLWAVCCPAHIFCLACLQSGRGHRAQTVSAYLLHGACNKQPSRRLAVVGCPLPLVFHRPAQISCQAQHSCSMPIQTAPSQLSAVVRPEQPRLGKSQDALTGPKLSSVQTGTAAAKGILRETEKQHSWLTCCFIGFELLRKTLLSSWAAHKGAVKRLGKVYISLLCQRGSSASCWQGRRT
jgi:hypothetical protein